MIYIDRKQNFSKLNRHNILNLMFDNIFPSLKVALNYEYHWNPSSADISEIFVSASALSE